MSIREAFLVVHRWIGIGAGIFFGIASLTGALLVFEPELNQPRGLTPGDIGVSAAQAAVMRAYPGAELTRVRFPRADPGSYAFDVRNGDGVTTLHVDAGSGAFVETAPTRPLFNVIRRAHTTLLAGRPGHWVVTVASLLALVALGSGIVLWWPGLRRFWNGFTVRLRRDFYILNFDLHQLIGIIALPLLFVMTLTGVLMPFGRAAKVFAHAITLDFSRPAPLFWPTLTLDAPPAGAVRLALDPAALIAIARRPFPDGQPLAIRFPRAQGPIEAVFSLGGNPYMPVRASIFIDPFSGKVVQVRDPRTLTPATRLRAEGFLRLHAGPSASLTVRWLYFLACLAGAVLVPTGLIVWWLKRRRKEIAVLRRREGASAG